MHLTQIHAKGLKSGDFTHTLQPVTLFTGNSASGKTSRMDAVRLALTGSTMLGRTGELKNTKSAILDLARKGTIEVSTTDSMGRTNARKWTKKDSTDTCEIPATPDILLDSGEYFRLSESKKIEYAFSLYQMDESSEFSGPAISAAVRNIKLEYDHTPETVEIVNELVGIVEEKDRDRHFRDGSIQELLSELITDFKERLKLAKATCDRMTKAVQAISQISANDAVLRNPEAELAALRAKSAALMVKKGELTTSLKQIEDMQNKRREIENRLKEFDSTDESESVSDQVQAIAAQIADIESEIEKATVEITALRDEGRKAAEEQHATLAKLNTSIDGYKSVAPAIQRKIDGMEMEINRIDQDMLKIEKEKEAMADAHRLAMSQSTCPHCGSASEHWTGDHSKASIKARFKAESARLESDFSAMSVRKSELIKQKNLAETALAKAIEDDKEHETNCAQSRNIQSRITSSQRILDQQIAERENAIAKARSESKRLVQRQGAIAKAFQDHKILTAQLAELDKDIYDNDPSPIMEELTALNLSIQSIDVEIETLETVRRQYLQSKADESRNAKALMEHAKSKADVDVTKAAIETLEETQGRMVTAAFANILRVVNKVTAAVMPEPIEYRDGELGRFVGATWIKHGTFSGAQKAVTYAGISVALARTSPIKLVMIDEMGTMDPALIERFMVQMTKLVADGVVDQFIGCTSQPCQDLDGVSVIRL